MITYIFLKNNYASLYNNLFEINRNDKTLKRFWTGCKNIKSDSLKFLSGNRDSTDDKTDDSRLFPDLNVGSDFRLTSGPRLTIPDSWLEIPKIYLSQTRTGKGRI